MAKLTDLIKKLLDAVVELTKGLEEIGKFNVIVDIILLIFLLIISIANISNKLKLPFDVYCIAVFFFIGLCFIASCRLYQKGKKL